MAATRKNTPRRPSKTAKRSAPLGTKPRKKAAGRKVAVKAAVAKSAKPTKPTKPAKPEEMRGYYRDMLLIRRFEERAGQLYGTGLIGGFCHL